MEQCAFHVVAGGFKKLSSCVFEAFLAGHRPIQTTTMAVPPDPTSPQAPPSAATPTTLQSVEASPISDSDVELVELEQAVESLPSVDGSVTDGDDENEVVALASPTSPTSPPPPPLVAPVNTSGIQIDGPNPGQAPCQLEDWLRVSGQSLGVATTATSTGFNIARGATAVSLTIAKRLAQVAVALPAMAFDSVNGNVPGGESATVSAIAHQSVGGLFDLISTLALGGIDLGSALTTAGLGAASTGVEGIRRTLGSEVVKSLGQFVKLVQREWNADNASLPPGGLPPFGLTGVTRALTVWICIQMVTHQDYERKMLKELQEFDIDTLRREIDEEHRDDRRHGVGGISKVTITSEEVESEMDVIGAEVGGSARAEMAPQLAIEPIGGDVAMPLSEKEAMRGLLRYSSLVLAVYGGVALAWLGSLPSEEAQQQQAEPTTASTSTAASVGPLPADGLTREQDEEQFLLAASMMDLTEEERGEAQTAAESGATRARRRMPGAMASSSPDSLDSPRDAGSGQVIFNAEPGEEAESNQRNGVADAAAAASPAPLTPSRRSEPSAARTSSTTASGAAPQQTASSYSYLNLISGQHDEELFHRVGNVEREHVQAGSYDEYVQRGQPRPAPLREGVARPSQPRYYIVTDHRQRKVVLVLRGSLSLGDIATDLTCESREFYFPDPAAREQRQTRVPFPAQDASTAARSHEEEVPLVHEGMYETALSVGSPHRPVHRAVGLALEAQPGYNLDVAGHSLGAGVASLLAIMWANPETTLTTAASGLPTGRKLHAYCYACPCTMSGALSRRCQALITTYAYSYDLVCRLSLGSIQDIRNASAWILYEDQQSRAGASAGGSSSSTDTNGLNPLRVPRLLTRAFEHQSGRMDNDPEGKARVEQEFLALRRALEANMTNVELYPPGQVLYLFSPDDLAADATATSPSPSPSRRRTTPRAFTLRRGENGKVGKVEDAFGQIIFSRRLLSCHMPSVYDKALRGVGK